MDLFESTLDDRGLSALVDDLRACAEVLGVREKGGAAQTSELSDGAGLAEAAERLRRGLRRRVAAADHRRLFAPVRAHQT